ncbi:MAG: tRNA (adenosine(37)-N6)-dimethylallyltransferase MiaA [bacterium]|nr:tRNA (adenosine(37)-N6)-dimethylallyltransferase MiaA [bacterium]
MAQPKIVVIIGPTASGKSRLAIKLAKKFNGEIVSADSRQIYRGMDIGTAKPTKKEMGSIPHHLINIKNPSEDYSVAEYKKDATIAIRKILRLGKLPILVGGTGLYIRAVIDNLDIPAVPADPKLRNNLETQLGEKGLDYLFKKLVALDPEAQYIVDPQNPRRVIRALEVAIKTGRPFTAQRKTGKKIFDACIIGIQIPVSKLRRNIDGRVDKMIEDGLIEEVQKLVKKYDGLPKAFDAIGYREIIDYLNKKITLAEAVGLIKKNTWRYAKRQMTWFKRDERIRWVKNKAEAMRFVNDLFPRPKE